MLLSFLAPLLVKINQRGVLNVWDNFHPNHHLHLNSFLDTSHDFHINVADASEYRLLMPGHFSHVLDAWRFQSQLTSGCCFEMDY